MDKQVIRTRIKDIRQKLNSSVREQAALQVTQHIKRARFFHYSHRIAFYLAIRGELETGSLIDLALASHKHCYLPALNPLGKPRLCFMPYDSPEQLITNRYHILEPAYHFKSCVPWWILDIIFMPLVAFDTQGNRLGMGAGYYDRTLANIHLHPQRPKPLLVGLAYEFQKVDRLTAEPWDVKLNYIVTERMIYKI